MNVKTAGRTDLEQYFSISGVFKNTKLTHTPLLVFVTSEDTVTVEIIDRAKELLNYPDATPVMGQWRGEWRSDFFQFTVGQYRAFLEAGDDTAKHKR